MNDAIEQLRQLGMSPRNATAKGALYTRCDQALDSLGASDRRWSLWVPGRIEVLGKHTDYAGGRSLLTTVERGFCVRVAPRRDNHVRVLDVGRGRKFETTLDGAAPRPSGEWEAYVATVARRTARDFPGAKRGADIALASDLPAAAGLSSSSALIVAVFIALSKANDLGSKANFRNVLSSREELAAYLGSVESGGVYGQFAGDAGVGTLGGSQDHTAILCCEAGNITRFAFLPVRREAVIRLLPQYTFALGVSGVAAEKTGAAMSGYNRCSLAVERLLHLWNQSTKRWDASLAEAVNSAHDAPDRLRALALSARDAQFTPEQLRDRLEHFLVETYEIIPAATDALNREAVGEFGVVVDRSQQAAESLLGTQVPQTNALQRAARELGAVASSAFGGGFGGSVWAMIPNAGAKEFLEKWELKYREAFPAYSTRSMFFLSPPGPHAYQW
jgi:galactokinase